MGAKSYALRLLKSRLRSAWELRQALSRRDVAPDEIETVLAELREVGLVDDLRFAKAWIATRDRLSPRGVFVLQQELQLKGIDKATIQQAFLLRGEEREEEDGMDEETRARSVLERKQRQYAHLPPEVMKRRLAGVLLRRGFPTDLVMRILKS
ncbi:hypothetical protein BH11PAT4_BH11PAT4_2140 [soil metagenome]